MKFKIIAAIVLALSIFSCQTEKINPDFQKEALNPDYLHRSMKKLTDVIVHDIFSPPVASRNYVYPSIAAYEALVHHYPEYQSLSGQLRSMPDLPKPEAGKEYCYGLASIHAFLQTGKQFIFSEQKLASFHDEILKEFKAIGIPADVYERSLSYGNELSKTILNWSNTDNYKETRSYPKYSISEDPSRWVPTPPDYMDGIEPHWNQMRTMVLDSATQFVPLPPTEFDMDKNSPFYQEVIEVYKAVSEAEPEHVEIAQFWDCNPFVSHIRGHIMYATKKISPGGHWIGITQIATKQANANMMETMAAYTLVSISLYDAFISCWDEKYRSKLIRPETVINQHLDEDWLPILQTPPFPEHTSGHSVISTASAVALTSLFGEGFSFQDSTEVEYGLPVRSFDSFLDASQEAAISRLYGGIHYRPAIDYGVDQGKKVGNFITSQISLKK